MPRNQGAGGRRRKSIPGCPNLPQILQFAPAEVDTLTSPVLSPSFLDDGSSSRKVAIPRLPKPENPESPFPSTTVAGSKHRVNHACEPCRVRKTKCSGERPACRHCGDFGLECSYQDGKRDKTKRLLYRMQNKIDSYKALLASVGACMDSETWRHIERSMKLIEYGDEAFEAQPVLSTDPLERDLDVEEFSSNHRVSLKTPQSIPWTTTSAAQFEAIQTLNRTTTRTILDHNTPNLSKVYNPESSLRTTLNAGVLDPEAWVHQCDNFSLIGNDGNEAFKRSFSSLPPAVVSLLIDAYFESIHSTFPVINQDQFNSRAHEFLNNNSSRPPNDWLTVFNLVLAISSKYISNFTRKLNVDQQDHEVFFTRAYVVGMAGELIYSQPSLLGIQIQGLMSIYFLCTNQYSRAITASAVSISHAKAFGFPIMDETTRAGKVARHTRQKLWLALYTLDQTISRVTGCSAITSEKWCSVSIPIRVDEELQSEPRANVLPQGVTMSSERVAELRESSSSSSLFEDDYSPTLASFRTRTSEPFEDETDFSIYLSYNIKLHNLAQEMMRTIESLNIHEKTNNSILALVPTFDVILERWRSMLPGTLDFVSGSNEEDVIRERACLGFTFYSTKIAITRAALKSDPLPQDSASALPPYSVGVLCIQSALAMLNLLPSNSTLETLYRQGPWWCLTSYLMQAISVLVQELVFDCRHVPDAKRRIFGSVKKALLWLHCMSASNNGALHAWAHANRTIRMIAPRIGMGVEDLPSEPLLPMPEQNQGAGNTGSQATSDRASVPSHHGQALPFQLERPFYTPGYAPHSTPFEDLNNVTGHPQGLSHMDVYPTTQLHGSGMRYQYHPSQMYQLDGGSRAW